MENKVQVTIIFCKMCISSMNATVFLNKVQISALIINNTLICDFSNQCAVIIKLPDIHFFSHQRWPICIQHLNSGSCITVKIKIVCLSVYFNKFALICISGGIIPLTIPESFTCLCFLPYAIRFAGFIKLISDVTACIIILPGNSLIIFTKVMPSTINFNPAGLQNTANCIVILAVHFKQSWTGIVYIVAVNAYKLPINKFILVSCSRNSFSPINHRFTLFTIGTPGVSFFGTSCCLVLKCGNIMLMICWLTSCPLNCCSNWCLSSRKRTNKIISNIYIIRIVNSSCLDIINNINYRIVVLRNCCIICPHSHWNWCNYSWTVNGNITGLFKRKCK